MNPATETAGFAAPENARITIIDHAEKNEAPGTYLTAYKAGDDFWAVTVDYIDNERQWNVYGNVTDDRPLTVPDLAAIMAAHEDAQGIADYLNAHDFTATLNEAAQQRADALESDRTLTLNMP